MILLIEDNEDDVYAMQWACRKAQVSEPIVVLNDGLKARNYLAEIGTVHERPFVIFMDLKLPFYSGHEILEWMAGQPALEGIPVVVLSGSDEGRDHARAREVGARTYLVKPPSPEDVVKVLQAVHLATLDQAVVLGQPVSDQASVDLMKPHADSLRTSSLRKPESGGSKVWS